MNLEQELPLLPGEEEVYYVDADGMEVPRPSPSKGKNSALEQGSDVPQNFKPTLQRPLPVIRCTATVRNGERKGERCGRWSIAGATVCLAHGAKLPNVRKAAEAKIEAARLRIVDDAGLAVDTLFELLKVGTAENVRLGAAKDILDRAGLKPGEKIDIDVVSSVAPSITLMEKLGEIRGNDEKKEIEDAEVVEE